MGKRSRHKARSTRAADAGYFHGGAPGLSVNDRLQPGAVLGAQFSYRAGSAIYDPSFVYVTTDQDVARAYAGRYLTLAGDQEPGDLYRVRPIGPVHDDPDYAKGGEFPGVVLRCRQAVIVEAVDREISLSIEEQLQLERSYQVWGRSDRPIYDDDGLMIPSEQMTGYGVTREWTTMLRPWLRTTDVDARGRLRITAESPDPWEVCLDAIPSLDTEHQIERRTSGLACSTCGTQFITIEAAAQHQLGERQIELLTQIHGWSAPPVVELAERAAGRRPARWTWATEVRAEPEVPRGLSALLRHWLP